MINTLTDDRLADLIGKLSVFFCTEEYTDSRSSSAMLVYFSGVLGFSPCGSTFERPQNYTPKLSALIYCVRLCLLEATLPRFGHPSIGWRARASHGNLKRLNQVRERSMCFGCQAPMGELLSLRAYGRVLSRSDGPSFRVQWSDDSEEVRWDGGKMGMDQFRQLGHCAVQSATASVTRLMYGLRPAIRLGDIRDRLSHVAQGYSFTQDPANQLAAAHLDLSSRACLDPVDGLMLSERWDLGAVARYLREETQLLLQLMLVMFLRGGQAPRSTELFSLECWNGPSTSRGVYVHAGAMMYVTRHAKARRSTNQEFQVARYLPQADSELLLQYLAYVRPFAEMLRRICYRQEEGRRLLFSSPESPAQPWTAEVLTRALKKLTRRVCAVAFGVQIYRQLSIAVTEKHVKHLRRPFNRYDDKTQKAEREVAFAWQSGHRPLRRGTTYGIDGAYPDSLQPALLIVYHWVSQEWHCFLQSGDHTLRVEDMRRGAEVVPGPEDVSADQMETRCQDPGEGQVSPRGLPALLKPGFPSPSSHSLVQALPGQSVQAVVPVGLPPIDNGTAVRREVPWPRSEPGAARGLGADLPDGCAQDPGCTRKRRLSWMDLQSETPVQKALKPTSPRSGQTTGGGPGWDGKDGARSSSPPDLIEPLSQYHVVICKECKVAVLPNSQWNSHFKKHQVGARVRQEMKNQVCKDPNMIQDEQDLNERFQYPVNQVALPQLPVYQDGMACNERYDGGRICRYVCRALTGMKEHYWKEHGWKNDQPPGRSAAQRQAIQRLWREGVSCQRLFHTGSKRGYFEVQLK